MDIQLVGNAACAAFYIRACLCKSETGDLQHALNCLVKNVDAQETPPTQRAHMLRIGCCVLKSRRLRAQGAALPSDCRSACVQFTHSYNSKYTKPLNERYHVLKSKEERENLPENNTDIFKPNIID